MAIFSQEDFQALAALESHDKSLTNSLKTASRDDLDQVLPQKPALVDLILRAFHSSGTEVHLS